MEAKSDKYKENRQSDISFSTWCCHGRKGTLGHIVVVDFVSVFMHAKGMKVITPVI